MGLLLIIIVVAAILSAPQWPHMHTRGYGYYPSGGLGLVAFILLLLLLFGAFPWWGAPWAGHPPHP